MLGEQVVPWADIPADADIVVAHGPPHDGFGDRTRQTHVGSTAMTAAVERVQPRLMVCGHIHRAYGCYRHGATEIINASLVNEDYRSVNPVIKVRL
jgi:Icc-related predicted phosphoesterase